MTTANPTTYTQAMVYTLALRLKDLIAEMVVRRKERIAREDDERFRREEEVRPDVPSSSQIAS